jgi:hypothetical protein
MRKCMITGLPLKKSMNVFLMNIFLVSWQYAQMHQNMFITTPDVNKHFFFTRNQVAWQKAQMHQNSCLSTSEVNKYFFNLVLGEMAVCTNAPEIVFLSTIDVKNTFFS